MEFSRQLTRGCANKNVNKTCRHATTLAKFIATGIYIFTFYQMKQTISLKEFIYAKQHSYLEIIDMKCKKKLVFSEMWYYRYCDVTCELQIQDVYTKFGAYKQCSDW